MKDKNKRKTARIKYIIIFILAALVLTACCFGFSIKREISGGSGTADQVTVEIMSGASLKEIADILAENKIIKYPLLFRYHARGDAENFKAGEHILRQNMSYNEIIAAISTVTLPSNVVIVTIPEGYETVQTAQRFADGFAEKGFPFDAQRFIDECEKGEFEDFIFLGGITRTENRLEGYLFPATYTCHEGMTERDVIIMMLEKFAFEYAAFEARALELGMTADEIITLASIVEREGVGAEDFKIVSSVFHNRLNINKKLESCATVQFALGERKEYLSNADTRVQSPYNTYLYEGLPVGPIASPGAAAIEAALYPDETDYLFFVLKNGTHVFTRTESEHEAAKNS